MNQPFAREAVDAFLASIAQAETAHIERILRDLSLFGMSPVTLEFEGGLGRPPTEPTRADEEFLQDLLRTDARGQAVVAARARRRS